MNGTDRQRLTAGPTALGRNELELRMLAARHHVPGLRALVAERAMRADHSLDFIDDVRLALDEVCAIILANCARTDLVTVRLLVDSDRVEIRAEVAMDARDEPVAGGLSLHILESLADSLDHGITPSGDERVFRLCFARRRRSHR